MNFRHVIIAQTTSLSIWITSQVKSNTGWTSTSEHIWISVNARTRNIKQMWLPLTAVINSTFYTWNQTPLQLFSFNDRFSNQHYRIDITDITDILYYIVSMITASFFLSNSTKIMNLRKLKYVCSVFPGTSSWVIRAISGLSCEISNACSSINPKNWPDDTGEKPLLKNSILP